MFTYAIRRLLALIPLLVAVSLITFLTLRLLPGDAVDSMGVEARLPPEVRERLRTFLGLDQPILTQYGRWISHVIRGDFGYSATSGQRVGPEIMRRFPATLELLALTTIVSIAIGVPLGLISGVYRDRAADHTIRAATVTALALPNFWVATILIMLFTVKLDWFPVIGWVPFMENPASNLHGLILPTVTLAITKSSSIARMMRSSILDILDREYLGTARAKGLTERAVIMRHGLRNASVPVVTLIGLQVGTLIGGAVVVETIFAVPGIGAYIVDAVIQRDFTVIQGVVLVLAAAVVVLNLLIDLTVAWIDPRTHDVRSH